MNIQHRSFSGKLFQPIPKYHISINKKIIIAITTWGQNNVSTLDILQNIETIYTAFTNDKEYTHPFPIMLSLNTIENNIRTTIAQINKDIFEAINQTEYSTGFELFFGTITENIFTFTQIGQPLILNNQSDKNLYSIGQNISPALCTPHKQKTIPPLPYTLLGIYTDIAVQTFYFRFKPQDKLILLNRNAIPTSWFTLKPEERTLNNLSKLATKDNPHIPFSIAVIEL